MGRPRFPHSILFFAQAFLQKACFELGTSASPIFAQAFLQKAYCKGSVITPRPPARNKCCMVMENINMMIKNATAGI